MQKSYLNDYKDTIIKMVSFVYPQMTKNEISNVMDYSIKKRKVNHNATIKNNYTNKKVNLTLDELTNYIYQREPICTAYGVMFKKHGVVPNPLTHMIENFMENRNIHKKEMFKYPKGSEMFEKYNLLQLLDKIDCNGIYGVLGMFSSMFYNLHVAGSITAQGRSLISSATMFFEMFLSNNVKFASLNEVITFINNVTNERLNRKYSDKMFLDRDITREECFSKIILTCGDFRKGKFKWIPDERDLDIIWNIIYRLEQEDINRLYYKNNLYEFMDNTSMTRSIVYILKKMETPYLDPNEVPDEIKVELETLYDILKEFVYYGYQIIDRIDRCDNMIKNISIISDTDSCIVSFDAWYRFILNKVYNVPLKISRVYTDPIKYIDKEKDGLIRPFEYLDKVEDYDFYNDEIIERYRLINPIEIIPQDNLRYSIINIMAYCISNLINDYMINYTQHSHSFEEDKKCLIIMKNEFLFKRVLLTNNKKNYASIPELQEGNFVERKLSNMDIKGLPMNKSTLNDSAKNAMKKILYEDILNTDNIDQLNIIKKIAIVEKKIYQSLESGDKEFYKPLAIKSLSSYDDPMRLQGIKASVIWNMIRDDELEAIDLDARNSIDVVKVIITPLTVEKIKDKYPDTYDKILHVFDNKDIFKPDSKGKVKPEITALAIPKDVDTPEWVKEFIDYTTIINDNLTTFPTDSLGIVTLGNANINYSNIMKI